MDKCGAGVPPAGFGGVPQPEAQEPPGETPGQLAGEEACATLSTALARPSNQTTCLSRSSDLRFCRRPAIGHTRPVDLVNFIPWAAAALILAKWLVELWLAGLNQRHVRSHAHAIPEPLKDSIDPLTYAKSVEYTLAKSRFGQLDDTWSTGVLLAVLFSGALPRAHQFFIGWLGTAAWAQGAFLVVAGIAVALPGLPFDWHAQFKLEERFGFNTTTPRLWWSDRLKGLLLALLLGYPLLVLILKIV